MLKKLLFVFVLLLPAMLNAQKLEIGLNAGVVSNTLPVDMNTEAKGGGFSPTVNLKFMGNISRQWQLGVSVGVVPLTYRQEAVIQPFFDIAPGGWMGAEEYTAYFADPAISLQMEANYCFNVRKLRLYSGVSAGGFVSPTVNFYNRIGYDHGESADFGIVGGMQMGGTWFFVPWCGLNMQLGMSYYHSYKLIAFPTTAGLRFAF